MISVNATTKKSDDERDAADKIPHGEVDYEHPSRHAKQLCRECTHYIMATPPRCEAVKSPIQPQDWCKRFSYRVKG